MKKTLNAVSAIATIIIVLGALFKIMHWPGGTIFFVFGMTFFGLFFLPIYALNTIQPLPNRKRKITVFLGYFCGSLITIFLLSKIMHWPLGGPLFVITTMLFSFIFVPLNTSYKIKHAASKSERRMNLFEGISIAVFALAWAFKVMHFPFASILLMLGTIVFLTTYLPYVYKSYKGDPTGKTEKLTRLTLVSLLITMMIAFVFNNAPGVFMNSFALTQESLEASSINVNTGNNSILSSIQNGSEYKEKAKKARALADDLYEHIERMKSHLIATTCKISPTQADSLSPFEIGPKDNFDVPTMVLIGGDIENPRKGAYSSTELKNKIAVFREDILGLLNEREGSEVSKHLGLSVLGQYPMEDWGGTVSWEIHTFYHLPLAGVLNILSQLQNDVRIAENTVLTGLQYESLLAGNALMKQ